MPSIVDTSQVLTPAESIIEQNQFEMIHKFVKNGKKLQKFQAEKEKELKIERLENEQKEQEKKLHLKQLRKQQNQEVRQREKELKERLDKQAELKEKFSTVANRDIMIKKEHAKLRLLEINQFKNEVDNDRKHY